ncbi:helicase-exonuclease AddAB subunit AddB [Halalkalibacillus sediminis]|uniref:ATP-dependent helicase/deoxyribonuclease subunit B n=1 Tax=Halalkalibacillus sediminis TaxID=2018042 RepID=A0A2I0QVD4_9BACI|nr:helicase-exonuclease AddAB subunit AddB [Halalkalibacillus sediminis]PKR78307.1 helicase-exonuclease AddAB subunit AddB [Halalkalibacillus sediminis]
MGLQFILGRAGSNLSTYCLEDIESSLKKDPTGDPIFYIVPDQMAFQQEYDLLRKSDLSGSTRAQVFSFSRLAWYIFHEVGGGTKPFISSTGIQMMLRKLSEQHKDSLSTFQKALEKQGFIEQLEAMITELKRYRITPDVLDRIVDEMQDFQHLNANEKALQQKLEDLLLIFQHLEEQLKGHYIDSEDQLEMMVEKIEESNVLNGATIYIDGFHRFTPQEFFVIEAFMRNAKDVKIALTYDEASNQNNQLDLFYQTKTTYETLKEIAKQSSIVEYPPMKRYPDEQLQQEAFQHLERHFETHPVPVYGKDAPVDIVEAVHPRAEVERTAQEIIRLVRDEGFRYREIALLIRESNTYHDLIETIFEDYNIPLFIDEKKTMLNHPFIELIRTGLEVVESNWRYDAIFRLLKTGFIRPSDETYPLDEEAIDTLENYVLEYGIRRKDQWLSEKTWTYQRFSGLDFRKQTTEEIEFQEKINSYRLQVVEALSTFDRSMNQAGTVKEKCRVLYEWVEDVQVPNKLEQLRDDYEEAGQVEIAREQEQAWQSTMELLDEMVEMLGEEEVDQRLFIQMMDAGFDTLTFSHVPPTIDHVIIGNVERSRITNVRASFLLGVNDGTFPMKPPSDGMVTDEERAILEEKGLLLADRADRVLLDDRFYIYLAFNLASERLWVSYPLSDEEGRTKIPASIVKRLETMFPEAKKHWVLDDEDEVEPLRFITNPTKSRAILTAELSKYLRGYPVNDVYWDTLHWYMEHETKDENTRLILESLFYQNKPSNLQQVTAKEMFDQTIRSSVSRLETYHQCSYQYFARYTLGLKERQGFQLDAPDIGQLFHESLRMITDWVHEDGKALFQLTKQEILHYVKKAMDKLAPVLHHQILFSSNRYRFILKKLEQVVIRATSMLVHQAKNSDFTPAGVEIGFGQKQKLPPLQLNLSNGYMLELSGRVDRVDQTTIDDQLYLRVIDYKSSSKDLSLVDVYYGLALQMLTYLDVVLTHSGDWLGKKADPAGVLYFHVHNPTIQDPKSQDDEAIEKELEKSYKMKGLLLEKESIAQAMDNSLESGVSTIAPFGVKKDGSFRSGSKTVNEEMFQRMNQYVRSLMTNAGEEIVGGEVHLNPFQKKDTVACTYCPYQSVCQFDSSLEENNFRRLNEGKDEEILAKMIEKGGVQL